MMQKIKNTRYHTAAIVIGGIMASFLGSHKGNSTKANEGAKKRQNELDRNLLTPVNATFGIAWGIIYTGTIALMAHQASSGQLHNPRYTKAQPWFRANYILGSIFGYFFSRPDKTGRVGAALTTIGMLPAAIGLHRSLEIGKTVPPQPEHTLQKSVSLYTGWLAAASGISITNLIQEAGYFVSKESAVKWTQYAIPTLVTSALVGSKKVRDPYILIPIATALLGIAAKQQNKNKTVAQLALTMAAALLVDFLKTESRCNTQQNIVTPI